MRPIVRYGLFFVAPAVLTNVCSVRADTLVIAPALGFYELYEPIAIRVHLYLGPESSASQRQLGRRIVLELWNETGIVGKGYLSGGSFQPVGRDEGHTVMDAWGCLSKGSDGGSEDSFSFWDQPGRFHLAVFDPDNGIRSEFVDIEFTEPKDSRYALLFAKGGFDTLALVHLREPPNAAKREFARIIDEAPESKWSQLLDALLYLSALKSRSDPRVHLPSEAEQDRLVSSANAFYKGHPLRSLLLLEIAKDAHQLGRNEIASAQLEKVVAETTDRKLKEEAIGLREGLRHAP